MKAPKEKKNWSTLTDKEKDKSSRTDKLAFFEKEKLKLLKNIAQRDEHEKAEKDGNPPAKESRIRCHDAISKIREQMDDLTRRLKPAPKFNYSNDDVCREEYFRMADKTKHKRQIAKESTGSPANSLANDPDDSEYVDSQITRKSRSGKNVMGTRASTRSTSKKEPDTGVKFEKQRAIASTKAQNGVQRKYRNPEIIELVITSEDEAEPETEYEYHLKPLPNPDIPSGYPRYDYGDVVIMLYPKEPRFQYQLHEQYLRGKSSRLDAELNKPRSKEASQKLKNKSTEAIKRLGLSFYNGEWFIGRTPFTTKHPKGDSSKPCEAKFSEPPFEILESFNNLFMIFYELPPDINTNDINIGFKQTGWLIELSCAYKCEALALKAIRQVWEPLGNHLVTYILQDPPRWLSFGWKIQSTMIVREAMIHVVAIYPDWIWPTDRDILTSEIKTFVEDKAEELWVKQVNVILNLTKNSNELTDRGKNGSLLVEPCRSEFHKMLVTAIWQDWFRQQRIQCNNANAGNLFRTMENPVAYLSEADLRAKLSPFQDPSFGNFEVFVSHLNILKVLAQEQASTLTQNFSKIDTQKLKDLGIGWLTCINVEEHELPWRH